MAETVDVLLRLRGGRQFQSEANKSARSIGGITKSVGATAASFVGWTGAVYAAQKVGRDMVSNAVNLGEQINKTAVVFRGPGAAGIQAWSKTTAKSLGISQRASLEAAGTFGNMLVPMGFARERAAGMSQRMVELASDMASFNNASPEETLTALRSGLAGETEPLRRFGVFLNDARLKQEAMNLGLKNAVGPNGALTANAKAQATYSLILKDSKDAQGDFARTSGSLANQQRILRAQYEQVTATLGLKLIPVLQWMIKNLPTLAIVLGTVAAAFMAYRVAAFLATVQTTGFVAALVAALSIPGLIVAGIILIIGALVLLYTKCEWFRNAVNAVWAAIKTGAVAAFNFVTKHWRTLLVALTGPFGVVVVTIVNHWDEIKNAAGAAITWIMEKLRPLLDMLNSVANAAGSIASKIGDVGGGALGAAEGFLGGLQHGGTTQRAGVALVGERGPELVRLPRGANVIPVPAVTPIGVSPPLDGGGQTIVTKVYLDRRQIAEAVGTYVSDKRARR